MVFSPLIHVTTPRDTTLFPASRLDSREALMNGHISESYHRHPKIDSGVS
jgi:hypothetical protein